MPAPRRWSYGYTGAAALVFIGTAAVVFLSSPVGSSSSTDVMRVNFGAWLEAEAVGTEAAVEGMVFNFHDKTLDTNEWIYPRISGEKILWHLDRNEIPPAAALADELLTWQQLDNTGNAAKSYGAFPSLITWNGSAWVAAANLDGSGNAAYYSGDGLVIIEALSRLYQRAGGAAYLTAATLAGDWLVDSMIDGFNALLASFGGTEVYDAPAQYVDIAGNRSVQIYPSVEYNWIGALDTLAAVTGDSSYSTRATDARVFYETAQHASGYYFDHYDPWSNYPGVPPAYNVSHWLEYHDGNNQILADNLLNSALGAVKSGDTASAQAAFDWIETAVQAGGVPGYLLTGASGAHGFGAQDVYFDVVSSGQYRSLAQWLNESAAATQAVKFIEAAQDANGGWVWGVFRNTGLDATGGTDQAPHVGFWGTGDLSRWATSLSPTIDYQATLIPRKFITALEVTPAGVNISPGTRQFTATATYSDASTADVSSGGVYWWSDDPTKLTITQAGFATTVSAGALNVYATLGTFSDGAFIVVDP